MKNLSLILVFMCGFYGITHSGPLTGEMSKCLVSNTNASDKSLFIQWIYAAMSSHPHVQSMSNISPEVEENLQRRTADMIMELLTVRCKAETAQAIKVEGESSFQAGFELLWQAAMQELMSDAKVAQHLAGLDSYFDAKKLQNMFNQK
jgi:hypothetical protein